MHVALSIASQEAVFFVACDMPFLHNDIIASQIDCYKKSKYDCLVPRIGSLIEPLHAIYKTKLRGNIEKFLKSASDYSVRKFINTVNLGYYDLSNDSDNQRIFINLNTPTDVMSIRDLK